MEKIDKQMNENEFENPFVDFKCDFSVSVGQK